MKSRRLEEFKMPSFRSVTAFTITATLTWAGQASATGVDEASTTGKGIVGGALLGAEAVILVEAAIGVKPYWAYAVGGGAGAIAGGVGGFFMEENFSAKTNMFLLSGGMVLAIPTVIAMLAATQYEPPASYVQDQAPSDEPVADPPQGATLEQKQKPQKKQRRVAVRRTHPVAPTLYSQLPPALVGLTKGGFDLSVPALAVYQLYTPRQMAEFGVKQQTELRMPVFNVVF
jgi:hypothetical protein